MGLYLGEVVFFILCKVYLVQGADGQDIALVYIKGIFVLKQTPADRDRLAACIKIKPDILKINIVYLKFYRLPERRGKKGGTGYPAFAVSLSSIGIERKNSVCLNQYLALNKTLIPVH